MSNTQKQSLQKSEGAPLINPSSTSNIEKKSRNSNKDISQESDSFYKYYNKEIKVNQDEIPIVLSELIDAAYNYIQRESYEKALILLQKTEGVLDVVNLEQSKRDKYIAFVTYQNMAMCYQKLGLLEDCLSYLKQCLKLISSADSHSFYKENTVASRMKQIRQECKLKLQLCAILSQTQNHSEALDNSKKSVKLAHQLFKDLHSLCMIYIKKIDAREQQKFKKQLKAEMGGDDSTRHHQVSILSTSPSGLQGGSTNFLEDSISMVERTSMKLYPIIKEVLKRMIEEKIAGVQGQSASSMGVLESQQQLCSDILYEKIVLSDDADMRSVLGYLNQNEWIYNLNIGNIMQIQPLSLKELLSTTRNESELSRDSFLEKISLLSVSYFCVSTEMRFLLLSREQYLSSPVKRQRELESEFWHAKALEIACTFLPSECPLLNHILLSYQKHHDPSQQPIKEDVEQNDVLNVLRPLNGIESNKYQPIIRYLQNIKVVISPFPLSPLTKKICTTQTEKKGQVQSTTLQKRMQSSPDMAPTGESGSKEGVIRGGEGVIATGGGASNQSQSSAMKQSVMMMDQAKQQKLDISMLNQYSDEYYDQLVKNIIEDPQIDKKEFMKKLVSHMQSQDFSYMQNVVFSQHEGDQNQYDKNEEERKEENKSFDQIGGTSSLSHQQFDNQVNTKHVWSEQQQHQVKKLDSKKKKDSFQRVQKMMSYLEGDSLLRDIQKSLGNEEMDGEEEEDQDEDYVEGIEGDADDEALVEGGATDTDMEGKQQTSNRREPITSGKNKSQSSQIKSGSFTRPSSSMTYHTQSSQIRKRKLKEQSSNKGLNKVSVGQLENQLSKASQQMNQQQMNEEKQQHKKKKSSQTHSSLSRSSSKNLKTANYNINNIKTDSISKNSMKKKRGGIMESKSRKTNQSNSQKKQNLSVGKQGHNSSISQYHQSNKRNAKNSNEKQVQQHHNHLRSQMGSRLSNLFATNKSTNKTTNIKKQSQINTNINKRKQSKSSGKGGDMEDSSKRKQKKYKGQDISIDQDVGNYIFTEGTPHQLFQPSENIAHTYSFDIGIPHSHKNIIKENNNSMNSLQQQFLENQKILMKQQTGFSDSKKSNKKRKYGNLRQSGVLQQFSKILENNQQINNTASQQQQQNKANTSTTNQASSSTTNQRSKSNATVSKGINNLLSKLNQRSSLEQNSRQSFVQASQTYSKNIQKQNKENIVNTSNQKYKKKNASIGGQAFKTSNKKPLASGGVVQMNKEIEFLKNKMKEHFKFFSQYSPELKVKKKKAGSHSPPKKHNSSQSRQNKIDKSKGKSANTGVVNQIFATTDQRQNIQQSKKKTNMNSNLEQEDHSWFLNDQSFNDFIRNTLGSNDENKAMQGVGGAFETDLERPSLGGGIHRGSSDIIMFNTSIHQKSTTAAPNQNSQKKKGKQQNQSKEGGGGMVNQRELKKQQLLQNQEKILKQQQLSHNLSMQQQNKQFENELQQFLQLAQINQLNKAVSQNQKIGGTSGGGNLIQQPSQQLKGQVLGIKKGSIDSSQYQQAIRNSMESIKKRISNIRA